MFSDICILIYDNSASRFFIGISKIPTIQFYQNPKGFAAKISFPTKYVRGLRCDKLLDTLQHAQLFEYHFDS